MALKLILLVEHDAAHHEIGAFRFACNTGVDVVDAPRNETFQEAFNGNVLLSVREILYQCCIH
jgi:hypothetical protein